MTPVSHLHSYRLSQGSLGLALLTAVLAGFAGGCSESPSPEEGDASAASVLEAPNSEASSVRIADADLVFHGVVTDISYASSVYDGDDTLVLPHTFVTWRVERTLKGSPDGEEVTLRFVGGPTGDGRRLTVSDIPTFEVGEQDILFARGNGTSACPLVACSEGRVRLISDGQVDELWEELATLVSAQPTLLEGARFHNANARLPFAVLRR